jgi:hypothetical protein
MITLQVTPLQYDIIKAAVAAYTDGIFTNTEVPMTVTVTQAQPEVRLSTKKPAARWGLKKDGTPRARPGRKPA